MESTPSGFWVKTRRPYGWPGFKNLDLQLRLFAESEAEETIYGDRVTELFTLGFK
jgi:hypothetical protein